MKVLSKIQDSAVKKAHTALARKGQALIQMATGTGKTNVALRIAGKYLNKKKRVLWLTHLTELSTQTHERAYKLGVTKNASLFTGQIKDKSGDLVVASIPTLRNPKTLAKFKPKEFDLVIVDEAHHTPASTWEKVVGHFKANKLGVTATPFRPDNRNAQTTFGKEVVRLSFSEAQKKKVIAKHEAWAILTTSVIEGLKVPQADYSQKQLDKLYSSVERNNIIVDSYIKRGRNSVLKAGMKPKAICFCINANHALKMVSLFRKQGISSDVIISDLKVQSKEERKNVMETFLNTHDIEVLCAVNIFNEGIDVPDANIGIMARPTRSAILYTQQVGRISRKGDRNKKFFVLLDYVDNTGTDYVSYQASNLDNKGYSSKRIVTDYYKMKDPILVDKRVKSLMLKPEAWENQQRLNYDLQIKEQRVLEAEHNNKYLKKLK